MPKGGSLKLVRQVTDRQTIGASAIPVYGYTSLPAGMQVEGGSAIPVRVISDSELRQNGGVFIVDGDPQPMQIMDAPVGVVVEGGNAIPVYPMNGWGGGTKILTYSQLVQQTFGASLLRYYPLDDPVGSNVARDISGYNSPGAHGTGLTCGVTGIGDGLTATRYTGAHQGTNIYSVGLNSLFNKSEGTIMVWFKVSAVGVWTDGTVRNLVHLRGDGNNRFYIRRETVSLDLNFNRSCGGSSRDLHYPLNLTGWHCCIVTWSVANNECWSYIDGIPFSLGTLTPIGTWSGNLDAAVCGIGRSWAATDIWSGDIAHVAIATRPLTWIEAMGLSVVNPAPLTTLPRYLRTATSTLFEGFNTVGDWTADAGSVADNVTEVKEGGHSVKLTTPNGSIGWAHKTISWTCSDLDGHFFVWFYCHNATTTDYTKIGLRISSSTTFTTYFEATSGTLGTVGFRGTPYPGWNCVRFSVRDFIATGAENWANTMVRLAICVTPAASKIGVVSFDDLEFGEKSISAAIINHDDGHASVNDAVNYELSKGIRPSLMLVPLSIGAGGGYMSLADIQGFAAQGAALCNHTWDHTDLTTLTEVQQEAEFLNAYNQLIGWGFSTDDAKQCGYPGGASNANSITALTNTGMQTCWYGWGCNSRPEYLPYNEPYHLAITGANVTILNTLLLPLRQSLRSGSTIYWNNDRIDLGGYPTLAQWKEFIDTLYAAWKAGLVYPITATDFYKATLGSIVVRLPK